MERKFELVQWVLGNYPGRVCAGCKRPVTDHVWGSYGYFAAFPPGSHAAGESLARMLAYGRGCEPGAGLREDGYEIAPE